MKWYYAIGNERLGPVEDDEWQKLVDSGQIQPDTLVWHEGMTDWMAYSELLPKVAPAPTAEEITASISEEDPEALVESIRQRDYQVNVIDCLSRAIALLKSRFWVCASTTFLLYLVMAVAGMIPCLGIFASMVVNGPVIGGLYWFYLTMIREGDATIADGFAGFNREFVQLMLCTVVSSLVMAVFFIPFGVLVATSGGQPTDVMPSLPIIISYIVAIVAALYFGIAWLFAPALIIDKRFRFWPAMEVSRRVVNMHWFRVFALPLVVGLVMVGIVLVFVVIIAALGAAGDSAGAAASGLAMALMFGGLIVGVFFVMPLFFAAITYAYEGIFGETAAKTTR